MVAMRMVILLFAGSLMIGGCAVTAPKPEITLPPPTTAPTSSPSAKPEPHLSAPIPVLVPEPPSGKVILTADALFDSDKAVLGPEAIAKLDKLAVRMQSLESEHIVVVGHADRLEAKRSDIYAQALAQRRADAVRLYLIKKGVIANRILTMSEGETKPETGNRCNLDDSTSKKHLVECLQPDRRVELAIIDSTAVWESMPSKTVKAEAPVVIKEKKSKTASAAPPAPAMHKYEVIKVYFGTNREATGKVDPYEFFSDQISQDKLKLGISNISIPKKHVKGNVEAPFSIFRIFTLRPNPEKHFAFDGPLVSLEQSQFIT